MESAQRVSSLMPCGFSSWRMGSRRGGVQQGWAESAQLSRMVSSFVSGPWIDSISLVDDRAPYDLGVSPILRFSCLILFDGPQLAVQMLIQQLENQATNTENMTIPSRARNGKIRCEIIADRLPRRTLRLKQ